MSELTIPDRIALYVGGGLIVLGTVVVGLLEIVAGSPHPVDAEGQIVHEALIPIELRSYIMIAGLVIWGLYAVYRVLGRPSESSESTQQAVRPE